MGAHDEAERVHPPTRAAWRRWLNSHHDTSTGVWFVSWRKHVGKSGPRYEDAVEEALCFGWIDSIARKLDDDRTMLWFSPEETRQRLGSAEQGAGRAADRGRRDDALLANG